VKDYTYIGIILTNKNDLIPEIERRIKDVNSAYFAILSLLKNQSVLRAEKLKIYKTLIKPVATYGAEFWTLNKDTAKWLVSLEKKSCKKNVWGN
jgi:hypothetical protein